MAKNRDMFNVLVSLSILTVGCILFGVALESVMAGLGLWLAVFSLMGYLSNRLG